MTDLGSDISTFVGPNADLDPSFALITGNKAVGEAVARRMLTPRGGLFYDPNYGYDLRILLNDAERDSQLAIIAGAVEQEALKDERVQSAQAVVTFISQTQQLKIKLGLTTAAGPFTLTMLIGAAIGQQTLIFGK